MGRAGEINGIKRGVTFRVWLQQNSGKTLIIGHSDSWDKGIYA
jgi:hypothetical protein